MLFRDFWFSYKNILLRQIIKKKYLNFLRKIFGSLYKFILRYIKHTFLFGITNLDNPKEKYLYQLKLDDLFIRFNCDKGPFCIWNKKKVFTHKSKPIFLPNYKVQDIDNYEDLERAKLIFNMIKK